MKFGIDVRAAMSEPAGIGKVALNLTRELARLDTENTYLMYSDRPIDFAVDNPRFAAVVQGTGGSGPGKAMWHLWAACHARFVAHADGFISVSSLQVAALTDNFTILTVPDLSHIVLPEFHVAKPRVTARWLMRRALKRARKVVAISHHTKNDILRVYGASISPEKVTVAHIGCDGMFRVMPSAGQLLATKRKYSLPERFILSVGTLEPRKNYPALIDAFSRAADSLGGCDLVIAGRRGWKYLETMEAARRSRVQSRIRILEFVAQDDLVCLYRLAHAFAYPSLYEGFGIPPLEAMTCGVPVMTSNVSSLPEVVGDAAVLVDPRSVDQLAEGIRRLCTDNALRERLIRAGRDRSNMFSWESFAKGVLACLMQ